MTDIHYYGAIERYVKGYDWKPCVAYLYSVGMTHDEHKRLVHLRREYIKAYRQYKTMLDDLSASIRDGNAESTRAPMWAQLRSAKTAQIKIVDKATQHMTRSGQLALWEQAA